MSEEVKVEGNPEEWMVVDDAEEKARLEAENEPDGDQDAENDHEEEEGEGDEVVDEVVDLADAHMDEDDDLGAEQNGDDKEPAEVSLMSL